MYDIHEIRKDFPVLEKVIYLDNGATSQTPVPAVEAMCEYFYSYAANHGRGAHRLARETTNRYEDSRETVADFLGITAKNVVLTKNTTESINIVAQGFGFTKGDHIITTLIEHHSNLLPWMKLRDIGVEVTIVTPDSTGIVSPESIESAVRDNTKLIAVTHISNVLGSIQDVGKIVAIAKKHGIVTLIDAAQSAGHMELDVKKLGCDYLVAPGHKGLLGPAGTGVLYMKQPDLVQPLFLGGGTVHSVTTEDYALDDFPSRFEAGTYSLSIIANTPVNSGNNDGGENGNGWNNGYNGGYNGNYSGENGDENDDDGANHDDKKDNKGKSQTPPNTPKDDKTTFKTDESNANGFMAKLPGFGLILAIFGMLAMAGYIKRRA